MTFFCLYLSHMNKAQFCIQLLVSLIFLPTIILSQEPEIGISNRGVRPLSSFGRGLVGNGVLGEIYLDADWKETILIFIDSEKRHKYPARFNLNLNVIEVRVFKTNYAVSWEDIKRAEILHENRNFIPLDGEEIFGELIYEKEDIRLLKSFSLKLKKANYNPALNTGQKEDEWVKIEELLISVNSKITVIKKKKDLQRAFQGTKYEKNKFNVSSINESKLIDFINTLSMN